jgi:tetratricopeptide (TPR) repeat protein
VDDNRCLGTGPRVFVSYAHDSAVHRHQVARLARVLSEQGVDVRLDTEAPGGRLDWAAWMDRQVDRADFVLVVASPDYRTYGDGNGPEDGRRRNVRTEAALLRDRLVQDRDAWTRKVLPVVLPGGSADELPRFLLPATTDRYELPALTPVGVDALTRVLFGRPRHDVAPDGTGRGAGLWTVNPPPPLVPPEFRDREIFVERLERALCEPARPVVAVTGGPGVGKTAVVSRLQERACASVSALRLDAFDYLSATGHRLVGPAALVDDLAQAHPDPGERGRLRERLLDDQLSWLEKADLVLGSLAGFRVLLVVDHLDELMRADGTLHDDDLQNLIEDLAARTDHKVTLLLVSRAAPDPRLVGNRDDATIPLYGGLPLAEAVDFLRDLDAGAPVGLAHADPASLLPLRDGTAGHPRALELAFATLHLVRGPGRRTTPPLSDLERLVGRLRSGPEHATVRLVDGVLELLSPEDLLVAQALAALGRPVTAAAVARVLRWPDAAAEDGLRRLARIRFVRCEGGQYYLPPVPDGERTLATADTTASTPGSGPATPWERPGRRELLLRAADHFVSQQPTDPLHPQDLAAHFSEIDLRVKAGQHVRALFAMRDVDEKYLEWWGYSGALTRWRVAVEGTLGDVGREVHNLSRLARAMDQQGDHAASSRILARAERLNRRGGDPGQGLALLVQAARADFNDGRVRRAQQGYAALVRAAERLGSPRHAAKGHAGLALCLLETGLFGEALAEHALAAAAVARARDTDGLRLRAQLLLTRGAVHRALDEHVPALRACEQAERVAGSISEDERLLEALCLDAQAAVLLDAGRIPDALDLASEAAGRSARNSNPDLARKANGTLALAHLRAGDLPAAFAAADAAARFSRSRRALGAFIVKGIVAYRSDRRPETAAAFWAAADQAAALRIKEGRNFQVLDTLGLALCGLTLCGAGGKQRAAVAAYRAARRVTQARGAVRRSMLLLDDLTADVDGALLAPVRDAARGRSTHL